MIGFENLALYAIKGYAFQWYVINQFYLYT